MFLVTYLVIKLKNMIQDLLKQTLAAAFLILCVFFAPWCGYSKRLKPIWDELADKYNSDSLSQRLVIANVDCTSDVALCAEENISGYPSLIFYAAGEKKGVKFQGKRDLIHLEEFISEKIAEVPGSKKVPPTVKTAETSSLELTDENFHNTVDYGLHFVKFYAPWCGHCQKMAGAWEELAQNSEYDNSVTISSVDCTKNRRICEEYEVKGYPTLLWMVDGKKVESFKGKRDLENFKQFVTNMKSLHKETLENEEEKIFDVVESLPDVVTELTEANFENAIGKGYTFVKFYEPWCGYSKMLAPIWKQLAIKFTPETDVTLAKVDCGHNKKLCSQYEVVGYPTLLLFHDGKLIKQYAGSKTLEQLHSFLLNYLHHTEL